MVLAQYGTKVSEQELLDRVKVGYGTDFSNIWNPTIAKLACEYGIATTMYALWPLLKPGIMEQALAEFKRNPHMNVAKYENPRDKDHISEPLPLSYKEMFKAVDNGCKVTYGRLTEKRLKSLLDTGSLVQTSIQLHKMYPGSKKGFHSVLLYAYDENKVKYHDPYRGKGMKADIGHLLQAASDVGAYIAYQGMMREYNHEIKA
jgi:hypothetical protein